MPDACEARVARLPMSIPAAIFIVLQIPAHGIGILSTVAIAAGKLPLRQAESGIIRGDA